MVAELDTELTEAILETLGIQVEYSPATMEELLVVIKEWVEGNGGQT